MPSQFVDEMVSATDPRRRRKQNTNYPQMPSGHQGLNGPMEYGAPPPGHQGLNGPMDSLPPGYQGLNGPMDMAPYPTGPVQGPPMQGPVQGPPMPQGTQIGSLQYLLDFLNPVSRPPPGGYTR